MRETWVAHGVFTEVYLEEALRKLGAGRRVAAHLGQALGAHHGFQAGGKERQDAFRLTWLEPSLWGQVRAWLVGKLREVLSLSGLPPLAELSPEALLRVMALASFADWIASDPRFFPYGRDPLAPGYWEDALEKARKALEVLSWPTPQAPELKAFEELFPFSPNPLQRAVSELLGGRQPNGDPVLLLVEAPMGLGKTEAALYAFHLLRNLLDHRGLYLALPTQATANGLFLRVHRFLEGLAQGQVDLQLQHGAALLNPEYARMLEGNLSPEQVYDTGEEEGAVVASSWFSAKKRAMLSAHGVGTLDQALLGVFKVKHHFIRLWGLMNRVVVLDEVHAYDTYTSGLLAALLRWLRALGSSVVLMTATLPQAKRRELLEAWGVGEGGLPPYPRVALSPERGCWRPRACRFPKGKSASRPPPRG
ncbi:HD domain-containing protein [Thermus sp.]|uniref:HD domain-containing protein n=1 Tax=Thermus sp. TaxID=275 RepID=UPI00298ED0E1|nr:HD domain-containing protein [Thermus sp.]MDW8358884.1 HD domain-containing protein [Thermus sp.]